MGLLLPSRICALSSSTSLITARCHLTAVLASALAILIYFCPITLVTAGIDARVGGEYGTRTENSAFYDAISEYIGRRAAPPANPIHVSDHSGTRKYSGIVYDKLNNETLDGNPLPAIVWFYMEGDTSCGGKVIREVPSSTDWTAVDSYRSDGNSNFSRCIYPITTS